MSDPTRLPEALAGEDEWARHRALQELREEGADEALLRTLIESLSDHDDPARRNGARMALATLASPGSPSADRARELLEDALRSDSSDLRILAASALGEGGNREAVPALIGALEDEDPNVVVAAADALGGIQDARAIEPLIRRSRSDDLWIRTGAVVALGRIRDPRALPALEELARVPGLEPAVIEAVRQISEPEGLPVLAAAAERDPMGALTAAGTLLCTHSEVAAPDWVRELARSRTPELIDRFRDANDPSSARLLGLAGSPDAVEELLLALRPPARSEAALAGLATTAPGLRASLILERLPAADPEEQLDLLPLLPPLNSEAGIREILPLLSAPDSSVRAAAAEAVGRSAPAPTLPVLDRELSEGGPQPDLIRALGSLGRIACAAVTPLLDDESESVRRAAAEALVRCADPAFAGEIKAALERAADPRTRSALLRALGRSAGAASVDRLARAAAEDDPHVRVAAIEALGCTGSPAAVEPLARHLEGPVEERVAALRALGALRVPAVAPLVESALDSDDPDVRRAAARAAVPVATSLSAHAVARIAADEDPWVRLFAARMLARRGNESRHALEELADGDPSPEVRREARRALASP